MKHETHPPGYYLYNLPLELEALANHRPEIQKSVGIMLASRRSPALPPQDSSCTQSPEGSAWRGRLAAKTAGSRITRRRVLQWASFLSFVVFAAGAPSTQEAPIKMTDIDSLGRGYNIVDGNPVGDEKTSRDPGWRRPVITLTYDAGLSTSDGRFYVPDQASVHGEVACPYDATVKKATTVSEYQSSLGTYIEIDTGDALGKVSFTANADFKNMASLLNTNSREVYVVRSVCQLYETALNSAAGITVTSDFRAVVADLPMTFDGTSANTFDWFFDKFGTHYSTEMHMGAMISHDYVLNHKDIEDSASSDESLAIGAKISFLNEFVTAKVSTSESTAFQRLSGKGETRVRTVGVMPPTTSKGILGVWYEWKDQLMSPTNFPVPIQYSLAPIADLLDATYFPRDANIAAKRNAVLVALRTYCDRKSDCAIPALSSPLLSAAMLSVVMDAPPVIKMPDIDFLGRGYNVVGGNPAGDEKRSRDPGWRRPVIQFTYEGGLSTADGRFYVPDQASVRGEVACAYDATVEKATTVSEYQSSLHGHVEIGGGGALGPLGKASFSASADFKTMASSLNTNSREVYVVRSECQMYEAALNLITGLNVTSDFRAVVAQKLPATFDGTSASTFDWFFDNFGTHYSTEIHMGAKISYDYVLNRKDIKDSASNEKSLSIGAKISFLNNFAEAKVSLDKKETKTFNDLSEKGETHIRTMGVMPPTSPTGVLGVWQAWKDQLMSPTNFPVPIQYSLGPISDLLDASYFPMDKNIVAKRDAMLAALRTYCDRKADCGLPPSAPSSGVWGTFLGATTYAARLSPFVGSQNGKVVWKTTKHLLSSTKIRFSSPAIGRDGLIYICVQDAISDSSEPHAVIAYEASGLKQKWLRRLAGYRMWTSPVVGPNGNVYVLTCDGLKVLDGWTGEPQWSFEVPNHCEPGSVALSEDGDTVYVGMGQSFYALDPAFGMVRWSLGGELTAEEIAALANPGFLLRNMKASVSRLGYFSASAPSVGPDRTVYAMFAVAPKLWTDRFGTDMSDLKDMSCKTYSRVELRALDGISGTTKWAVPLYDILPYPLFSSGTYSGGAPVVSNGVVYVAYRDPPQLRAFDARTGASLWTSKGTGTATFANSPAVGSDGTVYVGSDDDNIYAVDGATGNLKWKYTTGDNVAAAPAVGADGTVYIGSCDKTMMAFNGTTGAMKWRIQTGDSVTSSAAINSDGTVFVGSEDGYLYAFN